MIELIKLRDFQKHTVWTILPDGVLSVIGPTDSGKSSLIRALRWLICNDIRGTKFIRRGKKSASVTIKIDDHTVTRKRSPKFNGYILDGVELKAVGNKVPEQVARVLRISPDSFQQQHDGIFWFSRSPGDVSKQLNSIVNLEIMDTALAKLGSESRAAKTVAEDWAGELSKLEKETAKTKWVDKAAKAFRKLEAMETECDDLQSQIDKLDRAIRKYERGRKKIRKLRSIKVDLPDLPTDDHIRSLQTAITELEDGERRICRLSKTLEQLRNNVASSRILCPECGQEVRTAS